MSLASAAAGAVLRPWVLPVAGALLAGLLAALAAQSWRVHSLQADVAVARQQAAECAAGRTADRLAWVEAGASAVAAERQRATIQQKEAQRLIDAAQQQNAALAASRDALRGQLDGVRTAAAAAARRAGRGAAADPASTSGGQSADTIAVVLADVFGECAAQLVEVADEADRSRLAGTVAWRERATLTTSGSAEPGQ